jgi:DNA-binding XRE family transcriptional regulator
MKSTEPRPWEEVLKEHLRDPEFRAEWERLAPARAVAHRLILYRADHGLSQTALGRILGMSQPAVARLEAAEHVPSIETLVRIAERLNVEIVVQIVPPDRSRAESSAKKHPVVVTERASSPRGAGLSVAIR